MNRISGATLPCCRPVLRKPPSSVRLPHVREIEAAEDVRVGDRDGRPEGRIGHHDVSRPEPHVPARRLHARQVAVRELQRVEVVEVALAVAGHHHVHLAGADEERVEVATEDLLRGVAPQPLVPRLELFGCLDFRADLSPLRGTASF